MSDLHGVLVVDKPAGLTSAAVVARVKRVLGAKRVGHTGTLDPMATGVLPLCLGEGTKIAGYLLAEDKAYEGEMELGVETDTLDADGEVTTRDPAGAARVTEAELAAVVAGMVGPGEQIPPMYSALKRGGKRLYELARKGETVVRDPRPITIHALSLTGFAPPRARFVVHCSKGTYVRGLARDIGQTLGCGAHLTALRRTLAAPFDLSRAVQLSEINKELAFGRIVSPAGCLAHLAAVQVPEERVRDVSSGKPIHWGEVTDEPPPGDPDTIVRLLLPGGELLALVGTDDRDRLRYRRVFTYALTKSRVSSNLHGSQARSEPETVKTRS